MRRKISFLIDYERKMYLSLQPVQDKNEITKNIRGEKNIISDFRMGRKVYFLVHYGNENVFLPTGWDGGQLEGDCSRSNVQEQVHT